MITTQPLTDLSASSIPAKPDAAFLSKVLRDPAMWPPGFTWNYRSNDTCAVGLACGLWPNEPDIGFGYKLADLFDVPHPGVFDFVSGLDRVDVTPIHVADALDAAIAARGDAS